MDFWSTLIGCVFGGSFIGLIEFLIRRNDEKKDKNSEVLHTLKSIKEQMTVIESALNEQITGVKETIREEITGVEARMDRENADEARRSILSFDDELRRNMDHSEESFNQVLQDIKYYRNFCRTHEDYENDKATSAIAHIRETYQRVKNENKFI